MNTRVALCAVAALVCSTRALAGTYLEASRTDLARPLDPPATERMWFAAGSFRLENESGSAVEIFKDEALYLLRPLRKRYAEYEEVRDAQSGTQRVATETSRTKKVFGRTCTVWEITVNGVEAQELCVVPAASVPHGQQILDEMRKVGAFVEARDLGTRLSNSAAATWANLDLVKGIPVFARQFHDGHAVTETEVTAIRADKVPFNAFDLPDGYRRHRIAQRDHI